MIRACKKKRKVFSYIKEIYLVAQQYPPTFGHYKLKTLIEIIKIKSQFLFEIFKTDKDGLKYVLLSKTLNYSFTCLPGMSRLLTHEY